MIKNALKSAMRKEEKDMEYDTAYTTIREDYYEQRTQRFSPFEFVQRDNN